MNQNNKTGHFTCYKNRTFSFATDTEGVAAVDDGLDEGLVECLWLNVL